MRKLVGKCPTQECVNACCDKIPRSSQENVKISRQVAIFGGIFPFYIGQKWVNIFPNRSGQAPPQSGQPERFSPVFYDFPYAISTVFGC